MTQTARDVREAPAVDQVGRTAMALENSALTREQVDLLKRTVAKGATDDEFALFIHVCNHTGLNPFVRQIYCLKRRTQNEKGEWIDAMVTQTGIDGLRLIAERTGKYRGQTVPIFYDAAGNGREVWLDTKKPPVACKVGILREGFSEPLYGIALYSEYVQRKKDGNPNAMWNGKPTVMIAKCAEALGFRKAFPQEMSGVYAEDEMPPENEDAPTPKLIQATKPVPADDVTARAGEDGHIVLTFGVHKDKRLADVPTDYLVEKFIEVWKDTGRRATAIERIGEGFVNAVYAEVSARNRATAYDRYSALRRTVKRTDDEDLELDDLSTSWPDFGDVFANDKSAAAGSA